MDDLSRLEPKQVFRFFRAISAVPRQSAHEGKIADYLEGFAAERGLECLRDKANNVVIRKAAAPGCEGAPPLILQGHSDMVCVSEPGHAHDFDNQGLDLYLEGDRLMARGTSLGADDGIALAYALAILDAGDIPHPALEAVFTASEEIGMVGARQMDMSGLRGKTMLSFDSGGFTEGRIYVGCAGNQRLTVTQPIKKLAGQSGTRCRLALTGLSGGHSGGEIEKGRANAGKCMARLLQTLESRTQYQLIDACSGDPRSPVKMVITDAAVADILCRDVAAVAACVAEMEAVLRAEYADTDPGLALTLEELGGYTGEVFTPDTTAAFIRFVRLVPSGVNSMHKHFPDTPESSDNLGVYEVADSQMLYHLSIRASKESLIDELLQRIELLAGLLGFGVQRGERLCGWEYDPASRIKQLADDLYTARYGQKPRFKITHASTECGLFKAAIPELDVLSIGPIIYEEHTYNEYMGVTSVGELWAFLLQLVAALGST